MFEDRAVAGFLLAQRLAAYRGRPDAVVLAVPRGGLPVGAEVAHALGLPLDAVLVKKIGHPGDPEYALGAVGLEAEVIDADEARRCGVKAAWLKAEIARLRAELRHRRAMYGAGAHPQPVAGRVVLLVDDGAATGMTLAAAAGVLRKEGAARVVAAVPVASAAAMERLRASADEAVSLEVPADFESVGRFYRDFAQVTDAQAVALLNPRAIS